jgi:hypothetical protein
MQTVFSPLKGTAFSTLATGDSRVGKGVLGAIPIHEIAESNDITLKKGQTLTWKLSIELPN